MESLEPTERGKVTSKGVKKHYVVSAVFALFFLAISIAILGYVIYSSRHIQVSNSVLQDSLERDIAIMRETLETNSMIEQTEKDVEDLKEQIEILNTFSGNE